MDNFWRYKNKNFMISDCFIILLTSMHGKNPSGTKSCVLLRIVSWVSNVAYGLLLQIKLKLLLNLYTGLIFIFLS